MKKGKWNQTVLWIAVTEAVGLLSGLLSASGRKTFENAAVQPGFTPPALVFPIVWIILYALMGVSTARVWKMPESPERSRGLNLIVSQLIFNFFWSLIFFQAQAFGFAAVWLGILWVLTGAMTIAFYRLDPIAGYLQIPYLLWLTFAIYLNIAVWQLNPQ